jgi:hypothetical protein
VAGALRRAGWLGPQQPAANPAAAYNPTYGSAEYWQQQQAEANRQYAARGQTYGSAEYWQAYHGAGQPATQPAQPPNPESESRYTQNYYGQNRAMYETPEDLALRHRGTMIPQLVVAPLDLASGVAFNPYDPSTYPYQPIYGSSQPYQAGQGWQVGQPRRAVIQEIPGGSAIVGGKAAPRGVTRPHLKKLTTPPGPQPPGVVTIPPEQTVEPGYPTGVVEPPYYGGGGGYPGYGGGGGGGGYTQTNVAGGRAPGVRPYYGQQTRPAGYSAPRYAPNVQAGRGMQAGVQLPRWYQELVSWRGV